MQLPESVKVGAMTYEVRIVPDMYADRSLYGEVLYGNQVIKIAEDISADRQLNAFVHELYHAIKFESGESNGDDDEREIRAMSNMLTQVIKDNRWLIAKEVGHATLEH